MTKPRTVFVREATGLVRHLSAFDAFIMAVAVVSIGSAVNSTLVLLGLYPGTDLTLAFTIGLIPGAAFVIVYSIQTSAFPRSGGDYVWVSRIAGPGTGFNFSWLLQFSYLFFINGIQAWFIAWIGVPSTLSAIGLILKANYLVEWGSTLSSSANLGFMVAFISLILGGIVCIFGVSLYSRVMKVLFVWGTIGLIVWAFLLLTTTHATFVSSYNSLMSGTSSYEGMIKAAQNAALLQPTSLATTLVACIPLSWGMYAGFNYSVYTAGETKNVSRSIPIALTAGLAVSFACLVIMLKLCENVFGTDFMYSMSSLSAASSSAYNLPFGPSIAFLIATLTTNPILLFLASTTTIVWWFMVLPPLYMAGSRVLFAWSFDRLVPAKLASVNEKLHSPVIAITVCVVVNAFWAAMSAYQGYYLTYMNFSLIQAVGWAVPGFAAAVFPYVKKDLYEQVFHSLPKSFSMRIAGVPVLTIAGAIQGVSMLYYGYAMLWPTLTFTGLSPAVDEGIGWLIAGVVSGAIYYALVRRVRSRQGIDLGMVFKEIPPE